MGVSFRPLGGESLGVRSMATFVETSDLRILLDAGAALGRRMGKLPHPREYRELGRVRKLIREFSEKSDFVTISHYHFDHYTATWKDIDAVWTWSSREEAERVYGNKIILAKEYRKAINSSQRERGYIFAMMVQDFAGEIRYMDGKRIERGETRLEFSDPMPHGEEGSLLGYVLMTSITHREERLMHCADIQGPISSETASFIIKAEPSTLILSGPPLYLSGVKVDPVSVKRGLINLRKIVKRVPLTLVDHHLLRDSKGLNVVKELSNLARNHGNQVKTFAEHLGMENNLLEAERTLLYENDPPKEEFSKWTLMRESSRRVKMPPLD